MGTLQLVLLLVSAVLASALISQVIPRVSTPLVQIAIGVAIALLGGVQEGFEIPPDLFLVLFIAPLLFDEAKNLDRMGFWKNRMMILSLAIGLVLAITFAVGFTLHTVIPTLSFAAACALGAALGPTDAVAVTSVSKVADLSNKQKSILQGEALINDASGLVAFQFAIALALTGEFSFFNAGEAFLLEFFGGIGLGILIGFVCNAFIGFIQSRGLENTIFSVLFDIALPFVVYLIGDAVHVSGVLAVVACGIVFQLSPKSTGPNVSKLNIISSSTWDVITFALNGIVFVLLGIMLPGGMIGKLEGTGTFINWANLGYAGIVAVVVIACRFIWVVIVERLFGEHKKIDSSLLKHALILTLSGAKGAITLSIAMTIPFAVIGRADMIFYASCTIIVTLLLANFLIPVLAPADAEAKEEKLAKDRQAYLGILRRVIERLTADLPEKSGADRVATMTVIEEYNNRIDELKSEQGIENDDTHMVRLRVDALHWQESRAIELGESGEYPQNIVDDFLADTASTIEKVQQRSDISWFFKRKTRKAGVVWRLIKRYLGINPTPKNEEVAQMRNLKIACREYAFEQLTELMGDPRYPREDVAALATEYQRSISLLRTQSLSVTQMIRVENRIDPIRMDALRYEYALIGEAYSDNLIDRTTANRFRRKVSMMQLDVAGEI